MALPKSYLTSTKNLKSILQAVQSAQAPDKFSGRFLETLGFSSSNDRLLIGVLRDLGFLDTDGKPRERYFRYLDQSQAPKVMAEAVRESYADLFAIRNDAEKLPKAEVINKVKTLSQGSLSESVLEKFALTFSALVAISDFSEAPRRAPIDIGPAMPQTKDQKPQENQDGPMEELGKLPPLAARQPTSHPHSFGGLHYNIQIILPATRDAAIYDAIFRSLKEHLID